MTHGKFGGDVLRKSTAVLTCLALFGAGAPAVFAQATTAAIAGVILDPEGKPASGFKVVLRDVASNQEFTSGLTDAQGNYTAQVPLGGRYKLEGVIADDGVTKLPVQDVPPVSVLAPGTTRLNVRFNHGPAPAASTTAATNEKDKKKGAVPWYHRPGPIVGIVLGSVAVVALIAGAGGGGSSSTPASPSAPTQ
jgi:hypothetical protein